MSILMGEKNIQGFIKINAFENKQFSTIMNAVLEKNKPIRFKASGSSMSPFIRDGDIITIKSKKNYHIHCGDIVIFNHPTSNKLAVHRVISRKARNYLIKPDNGNKPDGWVNLKNIFGYVIQVERRNRNIRLGIEYGKSIVAWISYINCLYFFRRIFFYIYHLFNRGDL